MSECYPLHLQVLNKNMSIIVCDNIKYLSTSVQQDTIKLSAVVNRITICETERLQLADVMLSVLGVIVPLSDVVQIQSLHTMINIIDEENKFKSNVSEELDQFDCSLHVVQEIQFSTPLCHLSVVNCDISDEEACWISNSISHESLESIILINNNIDEQCLIKIITALQHSSVLRHICISSIVISNTTANLLASVMNCNTRLEHLCLSHCELKEQGMLMISESFKVIKSLRHCDLSDNYITNESAKQISSVILNNCTLSHLNLSKCKLQQQGLFYILDALKEIPKLTFVNLSSNIIDTSSAILLSKVVKANIELSHVDLSKCMITEEGLVMITTSLSELPSLCYINLSYNVISDQIAKNLSHCFTNIKHVLLGNCDVRSESLNKILCALQSISSLQQLNISGNEMSYFTAKQLKNVLDKNEDMNYLDLSSCILPIKEFWLVKSSFIKYLDISDNTFANETIKQVGTVIHSCSLLSHLKLSNCCFHRTEVKYIFDCLRGNKSICLLDLSYNPITNEAAMLLATGIVSNHTLNHLYLQQCDIPEQGFLEIANALKSCNHLRSLDFSYNNVPSTVAYKMNEAISVNNNLTYLAIASCSLTEQCTAAIADFPAKTISLLHLDVSYNTLDNIGAGKLATTVFCSMSLKYLDLSDCELSEKGFIRICKSLSSISNLKHLSIAENRITDVIAEQLADALSNNSGLNYLNLCNCHLQELGFDRILDTLCESNVLHHLNINVNLLTDQAASKLCDVIATSTSLTALEMSSCVSDNGMKMIFESLLKDNKIPLQCLDISFNKVGSLVTGALVNILSANKYLEHLDLSECNLSELQLKLLAKSLRGNIKLIYFNISHNSITDDVASEVASIIKETESLQYINLCNCHLQIIGLVTIADALSHIKTLKTLIFSSNAISSISANCIAAIITSNTSLEHVDLSNCMLEEVGKAMITHVLQQSTKLKQVEID